jgi:hypothetical protein
MTDNETASGPINPDAALRSLDALAADTLSTSQGPARLLTWVQPTDGVAYTTAVLPDGDGGWYYVTEGGDLGHWVKATEVASEGVGEGLPAYDALVAALVEAGLSKVPGRHSRRHPELSGHWLGFLHAVERLPHWEVDLE